MNSISPLRSNIWHGIDPETALLTPPTSAEEATPAGQPVEFTVPDPSSVVDDSGNRLPDYEWMAQAEARHASMFADWQMQVDHLSYLAQDSSIHGFRSGNGPIAYAAEMEWNARQLEYQNVLNNPPPQPTTVEEWRALYGPDGSGPLPDQPPATAALPAGTAANTAPWAPPLDPTAAWAQPPAASTEQAVPSADTQRIVITGQALPRDAEGNRYELGNDGAVIVHRSDGAILRIEAQQAQTAGLSAELAAVLALPRGAALPAGVATLITRGASLLSAAAPWTLAAVAAGGLLSGDTPRPLVVEMGRGQRYVQHEGQPAGVLQTFDPATGELLWWQHAQGYRDDAGRFQILPEGQRQYVDQPITTPAQPPGNGSPPPLPADNNSPQPGTPGYVAAPPAGPSVETLPAAPPTTANDLIIEQRNSEILGDNLRAAGRPPPIGANGEEIAGYDPHHILPSGKWPELDRLRQRFADCGIDVNDAANGVWLPGSQAPADATGSYHERLHNSSVPTSSTESLVS